MALNKQTLLASINIKAEAAELLGQPKAGKYKCFRGDAHKNGDATPSLTMDQNGYWKCHSCALKGDLFQLYMDINGIPHERFGEVILYYARKYNIDTSTTIAVGKSVAKGTELKKRQIIGKRDVAAQTRMPMRDLFNPKYAAAVLDWLLESYGISSDTAREWGLGWSTQSKRLFIPIPTKALWEEQGKTFDSLVNIRKHDIMRYHCEWHKYDGDTQVKDDTGSPIVSQQRPAEVERIRGEWVYSGWVPKWTKSGKVVGVRGHNAVYCYPMSAFDRTDDIWIVGGELKALMLIERGINALTFTSGETNFSSDLCELFHGRRVNIVYDIDETGQRGSMLVASAISDAGGIVRVGSIPPEGLPDGGDITDYLRKNGWNIAALENLKWRKAEPKVVHTIESKAEVNFTPVKFSSLVDGEYLGKYIEVHAIVSGKGVTPYAVPSKVAASCPAGEANQLPKCRQCSLARAGFKSPGFPEKMSIDGEKVVDLTGRSKIDMMRALKEAIGIPGKCGAPRLKVEYSTVDRVIIVPTVDRGAAEEQYRHQQVYLITDGKESPRENEGYVLSGKLIGDPKNHAFTMAAIETRPVDSDVFSYKFTNTGHAMLTEALWTNANSAQECMTNLVGDLRDNVLFKYGVDMMITVELMSWFMPFTFNIGKQYPCHKVCPEVMIIGDTRVGKSTMADGLSSHLGAGRFVDCGANPTFVGLVGGNTDIGNTKVFTWGVIPTTNRGHLSMDEANKLSLQTWGGLTNLKSSGIATRSTNSGDRKTRAAVRFLTLCNPRGSRPLAAYDTPLDAAIEVVGAPQDLARIDLLYVARSLKNTKIFNRFHETDTPHRYTKEVARLHLQWAWALDETKIRFMSPTHVLTRAEEIIAETQGVMMIAPTEAKFKIGRVAVAIACIVYSYDEKTGGVKVTNEHVDLAFALLKNLYSGYLENAGIKTGVIPKSIRSIFDKVENVKMLRILATSDTWGSQDFHEIFGDRASEFKYEAQLEHGLMTRRRNYYQPVEGFQDIIKDYINIRLEARK